MYDDRLEIINTGTLKVIDWCRNNANPAPIWEEKSGSVVLTFRPASGFTHGTSLYTVRADSGVGKQVCKGHHGWRGIFKAHLRC
jgi:hypothetical protein